MKNVIFVILLCIVLLVTNSANADPTVTSTSIHNACEAIDPGSVFDKIIYVDASSPGGDGSDWPVAFCDLQDALQAARDYLVLPGNENKQVLIAVAVGVYKPTALPDDRDAAFHLIKNVTVRGGYVGLTRDDTCCCLVPCPNRLIKNLNCCCGCQSCENECGQGCGCGECDNSSTQRACPLCGQCDPMTVLCGNIGDPNVCCPDDPNLLNNSYHVVVAEGEEEAGTLENLTVTCGYAFGEDCSYKGGGGMLINESNPVIKTVCFVDNHAEMWGGAVSMSYSLPLFDRVSFCDNTAGDEGGAMDSFLSSPEVFNCVFKDNVAGVAGGAVDIYDQFDDTNWGSPMIPPHPRFMQCTFYSNETLEDVSYGGALYNVSADTKIFNCIFWNDSTGVNGLGQELYFTGDDSQPLIGFCLVEGSQKPGSPAGVGGLYLPGIGQHQVSLGKDGPIMDLDPQFVNPELCDLRLEHDSPAIDAACYNLLLDITGAPIMTADRDCNPRVVLIPGAMTPDGWGCDPECRPDLGAYETKRVIFVDADSPATVPDGETWSSAFQDLQDALDQAEAILTNAGGLACSIQAVDIWVAEGTYVPTCCDQRTRNSRDLFFDIHLNNLRMLGGFDGTEDDICDRDLHPRLDSILSGELDQDNVYTIMFIDSNVGPSFILDNFTFTGGYANGELAEPMNNKGGAIYNLGSPTIRCVDFRNNFAYLAGGAVYNEGNPVFDKCLFWGNEAQGQGGGIENQGGDILVRCSEFYFNIGYEKGGGINNETAIAIVINSEFTNNGFGVLQTNRPPYVIPQQLTDGGAMNNETSLVSICGSLFHQNVTGEEGGAISSENCHLEVISCEFWNNFSNNGACMENRTNPETSIINSLMHNNNVNNLGGAMYNFGCPTMQITNCTLADNLAKGFYGGAIASIGSLIADSTRYDLNIDNSILWGNYATYIINNQIYLKNCNLNLDSYSIIDKGTTDDVGIVTDGTSPVDDKKYIIINNPMFVDAANDDYTLSDGSPAIGRGDNEKVPLCVRTDLSGVQCRIICDDVDLGAFESDFCSTVDPLGAGDFDGNGIVNYNDVMGLFLYISNFPGSYIPVDASNQHLNLVNDTVINYQDFIALIMMLKP